MKTTAAPAMMDEMKMAPSTITETELASPDTFQYGMNKHSSCWWQKVFNQTIGNTHNTWPLPSCHNPLKIHLFDYLHPQSGHHCEVLFGSPMEHLQIVVQQRNMVCSNSIGCK